ncbi:hypothetical protein C8R43DRAFT_1164675 [Mycena crocata]|nr:hypothetical protein C8R43DRAFT_1164675 [Mycena crocata]
MPRRPEPEANFVIRPFQPNDMAQIHALLLEGLVYGPDSPRNIAIRRKALFAVGILLSFAGVAFAIGALTSTFNYPSHTALLFLAVLPVCAVGSAYVYIHTTITRFFLDLYARACATDLADVRAAYGVPDPDPQGREQSSGGFWVAVVDGDVGSAHESEKGEKVIGCIGLACSEYPSLSIRRMFVSVKHRRRGAGSALLCATVEHARCIAPPPPPDVSPLELTLDTSEFQPGAINLYMKHGFEQCGTFWMELGSLAGFPMPVKMLLFRKRVAGGGSVVLNENKGIWELAVGR